MKIQVDIVQYGSPLPYASRVIPTRITSHNYANALVDVAFWSIIVFLLAWAAAGGFRHRKPAPI